MPRFSRLITRRAGPIGVMLTAWDIWRRIPKKQRRAILKQARKHGPTVIRGARNLRNLRKR